MPDVTDPVCGVTFDEESAAEMGAVIVDHEGARHHFCCETCAAEFRADPARYQARTG